MCGAVPTTSMATPTEQKQKKLLCGAVPPTSTASPTVQKQKKLLWGDVPPTEAKNSKSKCATVPTSQNLIRKTEVAEKRLQGENIEKEVFLQKSEILRARGDQQTVKKSTKVADFSKKVSEMRKICETDPITKCKDGPRNFDRGPICVT